MPSLATTGNSRVMEQPSSQQRNSNESRHKTYSVLSAAAPEHGRSFLPAGSQTVFKYGRNDPMKLLCIGDSNTYGYDPRSRLGARYPAEIRWTNRLNNCDVINIGINGMAVPNHASEYSSLISSSRPELIIVMLGVNDLLQGSSAENTASRMERFLTLLKQSGVAILLIAPPPVRMGAWVHSQGLIVESQKLTELYRSVADRAGIHFADAGAWKIDLTYDGVHFSPEGHAAFARGLEAVMQGIVIARKDH